jgi:hypothetical protein
MKTTLGVLVSIILLTTTSHAQKMVQTANDAYKLQTFKDTFVGKPFSFLLAQIELPPRFLYGNPSNRGESIVGTNIKFYFCSKEEYWKQIKAKQKPVGVLVTFRLEPQNTHQALPIGGTDWTKEMEKEYATMIVSGIYVTGTGVENKIRNSNTNN